MGFLGSGTPSKCGASRSGSFGSKLVDIHVFFNSDLYFRAIDHFNDMIAGRHRGSIVEQEENNLSTLRAPQPDPFDDTSSPDLEDRYEAVGRQHSSESHRRHSHYNQQRTTHSRPQSPNGPAETSLLQRSSTRNPHLSKINDQNEADLFSLQQDAHQPWLSHGARPDRPSSAFSRRTIKDEERDLTELVAPEIAPEVDKEGDWGREGYIESAGSDDPPAKDATPSEDKKSDFLTLLYTVAYLIIFSIFGTLARLGVQWLTFYPGAPVVFSNLWANFGGTLIIGFFLEDHKLFRSEKDTSPRTSQKYERLSEEQATAHVTTKKTIPLYIGLTVGFCGSFTSFSTFMRDVFFGLSNSTPTPIDHPNKYVAADVTSTVSRNGGYSFEAVLAIILLTVGMCLAALHLGAHAAIVSHDITPTLPFRFLRKGLDPFTVFLAFGCWLGAVFMCIWPPDRTGGPAGTGRSGPSEVWRGETLFALVFAPLGCLARWYASLKLNGIVKWFPVGTFAVNMFGVAVLSMCYDLQHVPLQVAIGGGHLGCQVLQGVQDGFCGCLTTVSTWILEMKSLRRRHGYFYGASSVLVGLALVVCIMGTVKWTVGFQAAACFNGLY